MDIGKPTKIIEVDDEPAVVPDTVPEPATKPAVEPSRPKEPVPA